MQLAGRGTRFHEDPFRSLPALIPQLSAQIKVDGSLPFAFFGHSMGGLLAFELARYHAKHGLPAPEELYISGCAAPRYRKPPRGLHLLSDADLLAELAKYNGTPREVLEHAELMAMLFPTIRADFEVCDTYRYENQARLDMPITVLAGRTDDIASPDEVNGWHEETSGDVTVRWFEGDHFFINTHRREVLDFLNAKLGQHMPVSELALN